MVRNITLIRHAKAEAEPVGSDFDRALSERGRENAAALSEWLAALNGPQPDGVYYSSAKRTSETCAILAPVWQQSASGHEGLYLASAGDLLEFLHGLDDAQSSVVLVGHNPGLHQLALTLAKPNPSVLYEALELAYPTSACALLSLELAHWRDLAPQSAELKGFWYPKLGA
jgi:phosphohistidine phosphatase